MKVKKKFLGLLAVSGIFAGAILLIASLNVGGSSAADPTGASYIATTGSETISDRATAANQAPFGPN